MPWDNNTGGGGRNSNSGGPWGQSPGGGGGGPRRGGTPSLEDILSRGRDQFQGGVPGGRWAFVGVIALLLAFWAFNAVYTISPSEVGVKLRFGEPRELSPPGLHFHWWPVETVERVTVTENQTMIGSTNVGRGTADDGLMLTGDQN